MPHAPKRFKKSPIELIEQLKYDGGLTYKKIAEKLGKSVSTVYRIRKSKTSFKTANKYYKNISKINRSKHLRVTKDSDIIFDKPKYKFDYMLMKFVAMMQTGYEGRKARTKKTFFISCAKKYYPDKGIEYKRLLEATGADILNIQTFPKQYRK